jgi:hypothetical protein
MWAGNTARHKRRGGDRVFAWTTQNPCQPRGHVSIIKHVAQQNACIAHAPGGKHTGRSHSVASDTPHHSYARRIPPLPGVSSTFFHSTLVVEHPWLWPPRRSLGPRWQATRPRFVACCFNGNGQCSSFDASSPCIPWTQSLRADIEGVAFRTTARQAPSRFMCRISCVRRPDVK